MRKSVMTVVAFALLVAPTVLSAKTRLPTRAEVRHAVQTDFVVTAADEGRLTAAQVESIRVAQEEVASQIATFTRDGRVTPREAQILDHMLDGTSLTIDKALSEAARTSQTERSKPASRG